jgi:hypothetical protein
MATLLAKNADVVVTMDGQRRELKYAGLFARDGVIEQVGPTAELPATADLVLDLKGHILLPGLINCHHHLDQILTRNLPAGRTPTSSPGSRHITAFGRRGRLRTPARRSSSAAQSWHARVAPPSSTTPMCSRTVAESTTKSTPLPKSASASSSRAEACRSASRRAGCRLTIASRTRQRSFRILSASSSNIMTRTRARCCRSCSRRAHSSRSRQT